MPFNPAPSAWITGYALAGSDVTIPVSGLPGLTVAEANAGSTGDIRKVAYGFNEALYQEWASLATADKPTNMTLSRSTSRNETTGIATVTYSTRFNMQINDLEVVDE